MNFLAKIYCHINNFSVLSNITIFLIGISILTIVGVYLFHLFFKKDLYERNINIAGIILRILMFTAFTFELYHQIKINSLIDENFSKDNSIEQLINFLFWGYIFSCGLYYIFTIKLEKHKGFFYTFDIVMLSVPIVQGIAVMVLSLVMKEFAPVYYYLSIIIYVLMLYSFFKTYWLRNKKWYIVSFSLSVVLMGVSSLMKEWGVTRPISVFIFLVLIYEILRKMVNDNVRLKKIVNPILTVIAIILILFCNPSINAWNIVLKNYTYDKSVDAYRVSTNYNSLENAEKVARNATGDYNSKVVLIAGNQGDFYNEYLFKIGKYEVREDESSPMLLKINRKYKEDLRGRLKKEEVKDVKLSKNDIINKSIKYIEKVGYTYDPKLVDIRVVEENSNEVGKVYKVEFYNKYTDGSITEKKEFHVGCTAVVWRRDGTLEAFYSSNILNLKDVKEVNISYKDIDSIVKKWYQKINENIPAYSVVDVSNGYLNPRVEVKIICKNNDELIVDGNTGEVIRFTIKSGGNDSEIKYDKEENQYAKTIDDFDIKNMKITKEKAAKLVLKRYKYFSVYNEKVKPFQVFYKNGDIKFKWMVRVLPYGTTEHHIYFVNPNTGDIHPLDNYKSGVKNEYRK